MARYFFYIPSLGSQQMEPTADNPYLGFDDTVAAARARVQKIRDLLRDGDGEGYAFNTALPSPRYVVSDILEFRRSNHYFFAFVVRDTTQGVEWLWIEPGPDADGNGVSWFYYGIIGGTSSGAVYTQYVGRVPDNTGGGGVTTQMGYAFYYNRDYATDTFDMEFDDPVALTYSGGDFSHTSTTLPADNSTKANAFLPAGVDNPRGAELFASNARACERCIIIDEDLPFMGTMNTSGADMDIYQCAWLGEIVQGPDGSGDVYEQALVWLEVSSNVNETADPEHGEGYVDAFTAAGVKIYNYNLVPVQLFTRNNWFVDNGGVKDARWRAVVVENGTDTKGWLKTEFARELGIWEASIHNRQLFAAPSAAKPMLKTSNALAFAYVPNVPPFPFVFPTKED